MPGPEEVQVEMRHADADTTAKVAAAAVKAWEEEGWSVVDEKAAEAAIDEATDLDRLSDVATTAGDQADGPPKPAKSTHKRP